VGQVVRRVRKAAGWAAKG